MTRKPDYQNSAGRVAKINAGNSFAVRLPFWFSAANYYVLTAAISIAAFFLTWGVLSENNSDIPWITAGIAASLVLIGAVVLRSVLMRKMQLRFSTAQVKFNSRTLRRNQDHANANKLTIERNALILDEIEKKSKAAQASGKLPDAHLEVFELCEGYLKKNESELESVGVGSPRLAVLRKSKEKVGKFHKYHLLAWASLESRLLIQDAKVQPAISEKIENSQKALSVLDSAMQFYPNETLLTDSINVVKEFITKVKVEHWTEQAERAAFKENYKRAINHYRDALFFLARENDRTPEKDIIAEKINFEIQKLSAIAKKD